MGHPVLTPLYDRKEEIEKELGRVGRESDPWMHAGQYYADAFDCSRVRALTIDRLTRELDRVEAQIEGETEVFYGAVAPVRGVA